ncbi:MULTISPECIES: hypothetical protein [Bacillus]|uniref:hypothetical protein n=1 Tax=Bacillus TaxID=1386 RepID=UPI000BAE1537|nr:MULTISPECIES: hypothetical protein [Bacillus]MCP9297931.1 hypothetical protein [Bacillus halotolerans]MEC1646431.1 hypothetical protein [Bacillus halotolerans]PAY14735.1 hypothetical protein CJU60_01945 [Bacillus sp. 7705b]WHY24208.1 hypothetical protein QNH41_19920 [Bacillus halotolerans]WOC56616.1 hypothetical protein RYX39_19265 [Bacillus halotolerans]
MFQTMRIGDWVIEADVEETRRQYAKDIEDMCECLLCENYREVMKTLPREKAQMFEDFGLQPSVCTDINEFGQEGDRHLYVASYFIVGRILEGKKEWDPDRNWYISFEVPRDDRFIPEGFPKPVLQLDCVTLLPWIMEEPY